VKTEWKFESPLGRKPREKEIRGQKEVGSKDQSCTEEGKKSGDHRRRREWMAEFPERTVEKAQRGTHMFSIGVYTKKKEG